MQLRQDGTPIITTTEDQQKTDRFIDKVISKVYDRLPRVVRMFLPKDKLAEYVRGTIIDLASGL